MIIVCYEFGQMGNQLYTLSNMIGSVKEHKIKNGILYLNFSYMELFPEIKNIPEAKVYRKPILGRFIGKGLKLVSKIIKSKKLLYHDERADDSGLTVQSWINNGELDGFNVVRTFPYYDYISVCKYHDYICDKLRFNNIVCERSHDFMTSIRKEYDIVIGLHIRRKDYISWHNGEFYFGDDVYFNASQAAQEALNISKKKVGYVICSDESIDIAHFGKDYVLSLGRNAQEDMTILSLCDYIISTQSTFSGWASFVGKVPAFRIREEQKQPEKKEDFMIQFFETDGAGIRRIPSYLSEDVS